MYFWLSVLVDQVVLFVHHFVVLFSLENPVGRDHILVFANADVLAKLRGFFVLGRVNDAPVVSRFLEMTKRIQNSRQIFNFRVSHTGNL